MGNDGCLTSLNMTESLWTLVESLRTLDRGNGGYSTSSNMTDTWWIRYGHLIGEMVDV